MKKNKRKTYTLYEIFIETYGVDKTEQVELFLKTINTYGFYGNMGLRFFESRFKTKKTFTINKRKLYKMLVALNVDKNFIVYSKNISKENRFLLNQEIMNAKNKKEKDLNKYVNYFYNFVLYVGLKACFRYQIEINDAIQYGFVALQKALDIINEDNVEDFEYFICREVNSLIKLETVVNDTERIKIPYVDFYEMIDKYLYYINKRDILSLIRKFSLEELQTIINYLTGLDRTQKANMDMFVCVEDKEQYFINEKDDVNKEYYI